MHCTFEKYFEQFYVLWIFDLIRLLVTIQTSHQTLKRLRGEEHNNLAWKIYVEQGEYIWWNASRNNQLTTTTYKSCYLS